MYGSAPGGDLLQFIHAERRFVVVEKPSGMLSVPGLVATDIPDAATVVRSRFPGATGPLVCHRLDQATSGLMVFGLDADAQRLISLEFQRGRVDKVYEALVWGRPGCDAGTVTLPLIVDWPNRPKQKVDLENGKRAVTDWSVIGVERPGSECVTRLRLEPRTGKTHQLRVHCAEAATRGGIGCPIVGDSLYDSERSARRLMLHARKITFTNPETLRRVSFESKVPF